MTKTLRVAFVGDVAPARDVGADIARCGARGLVGQVADVLSEADARVANFECVYTASSEARPGKAVILRAHPEAIDVLRAAGFDGVTLANNHVMDFGPRGLRDTLEALDRGGIRHCGAGMTLDDASQPMFFEENGVRVAVIAATGNLGASSDEAGFMPLRVALLGDLIRRTRHDAHHVVVAAHWGVEFDPRVVGYYSNIGRTLIDLGASLVVGHGPHVLQAIEAHGRGAIAYSLGNFIFDHVRPQTRVSGVLRASFSRDSMVGLDWHPIRIVGSGMPVADGEWVALPLERSGTIFAVDASEEELGDTDVNSAFIGAVLESKLRHGIGSALHTFLRRGARVPRSYYWMAAVWLFRRVVRRTRIGGRPSRPGPGESPGPF